jgi:hypothetical protein
LQLSKQNGTLENVISLTFKINGHVRFGALQSAPTSSFHRLYNRVDTGNDISSKDYSLFILHSENTVSYSIDMLFTWDKCFLFVLKKKHIHVVQCTSIDWFLISFFLLLDYFTFHHLSYYS